MTNTLYVRYMDPERVMGCDVFCACCYLLAAGKGLFFVAQATAPQNLRRPRLRTFVRATFILRFSLFTVCRVFVFFLLYVGWDLFFLSRRPPLLRTFAEPFCSTPRSSCWCTWMTRTKTCSGRCSKSWRCASFCLLSFRTHIPGICGIVTSEWGF